MDYLVSPEAVEFLTFTTELYEELGTQRYCTDIFDPTTRNKGAILSLTCERFDIPVLSICGELQPEHQSPIFGMWQLPLTREKIKEHLEEELNIYLNNGIKTFGPLLGKALKAQLHPELSNVAIDQSFPLKLVYLISGRQYIGTLQIPLVQSNLDQRIYAMMNSIRSSQPDHSTQHRVTAHSAASTSLTQDVGDLVVPDDIGEATKAASAAPAKKKRTGGVSVNPSRRKK